MNTSMTTKSGDNSLNSTAVNLPSNDINVVDNTLNLEINVKEPFEKMVKQTAKVLRIDSKFLQFFEHNFERDQPVSKPINTSEYKEKIDSFFNHDNRRTRSSKRKIFYFTILNTPVKEYEQQYQLPITLAKDKYGLGEHRDFTVSVKNSDKLVEALFKSIFMLDEEYTNQLNNTTTSKSSIFNKNNNNNQNVNLNSQTSTSFYHKNNNNNISVKKISPDTDNSYMSDSSGRSSPISHVTTPNHTSTHSPNPDLMLSDNESIKEEKTLTENNINRSNDHSPVPNQGESSLHEQNLPINDINSYRMLQFFNNRVIKVWYPTDSLDLLKASYNDLKYDNNHQEKNLQKFRIEKIPEEQLQENLNADDVLVTVFHFYQNIMNFHSIPSDVGRVFGTSLSLLSKIFSYQ